MNAQKVSFPGLERTQAGTLFAPDNLGQAAVLFMHGYKSNRIGYAEYAEAVTGELDATCLTIDLAGHGESTGNSSEISASMHLSDVVDAYDFLSTREGVDPSRIGVVGASYGGYLAVLLSTKRRPRSILLRAPAIYEDEFLEVPRENMSEERTDAYRKRIATSKTPNTALKAMNDFSGNVTIVESERDESILPSVIHAYVRNAKNGSHKIIEGAGHSLKDEERKAFKAIVLEWAKGL